MTKDITDTNPHLLRAAWAHWSTLFFYCALLALFSIHQWLRPEGISLFQWSVQCFPLLMFWFGLRKQHRRTYLWLCFVTLIYFIKGVEGVMSFTPDAFDVILLTASVGLFLSAMMAARWLYLHEKAEYEKALAEHNAAQAENDTAHKQAAADVSTQAKTNGPAASEH